MHDTAHQGDTIADAWLAYQAEIKQALEALERAQEHAQIIDDTNCQQSPDDGKAAKIRRWARAIEQRRNITIHY